MSQITTTKNKGLTIQQDIHPLLKPMIIEYAKSEVFTVIRASVAKCYADLNFKAISTPDKEYLVNELTNNILNRYPGIRLEEIPNAFQLGIRGEFGEFMGLSVITFENFIKNYLESQHRLKLAETLPRLQEKNVPTKDEIFEISQNNALLAYEKFKAGMDYELLATITYSFLDDLSLLNYSSKDKIEFIEIAKQELLNAAKSKKLFEFDRSERNKLDNLIKDITSHTENQKVIIQAKRIALRVFFECISLNDNNLSDIIDNAKGLYKMEIHNG